MNVLLYLVFEMSSSSAARPCRVEFRLVWDRTGEAGLTLFPQSLGIQGETPCSRLGTSTKRMVCGADNRTKSL